jgi:ubiquinone/menaquinone biosynthesis methyltransferase
VKDDIYAPARVVALFNEMAATYGVVNLIASLGFTFIWRRILLRRVRIPSGARVCDLMTGMGENVDAIMRHGKPSVVAIDLSPVMCEKARTAVARYGGQVQIREEDALHSSLASGSVDVITCSFGLKTFSREGQVALAAEVARLLEPGGQLTFIEIAIPRFAPLRWLYSFYLRCVIPFIGKLCLGNPDNYRMLYAYTSRFKDASWFTEQLRAQGLEVTPFSHFFGCASGVSGSKPARA